MPEIWHTVGHPRRIFRRVPGAHGEVSKSGSSSDEGAGALGDEPSYARTVFMLMTVTLLLYYIIYS